MQMIVASRLTDGRVVFFAEGARWVESIEDGLVVESAEELLDVARRSVRESVVVDPYLIEVTIVDGRRRPKQLREAIRASGPSVAGARTENGS